MNFVTNSLVLFFESNTVTLVPSNVTLYVHEIPVSKFFCIIFPKGPVINSVEGDLLSTNMPNMIMFSCLSLKFGGRFAIHPTIDHICIPFLKKETPSIERMTARFAGFLK